MRGDKAILELQEKVRRLTQKLEQVRGTLSNGRQGQHN